jgi:hypothetical protein
VQYQLDGLKYSSTRIRNAEPGVTEAGIVQLNDVAYPSTRDATEFHVAPPLLE